MRIRASLLAILHPLRHSFVPCQEGFVSGNPSGSRSKIRSRKPLWKSGSSSAMYLLKDPRILWSTDHRLPWCRSIPLRYLGSLRSPKIKRAFGDELRHHCLRCGHDQNVTSFIHVSSVPFLSVWYCRFQMRLSCPATKNSTPQEMIFFTSWAKLSDHEILVQHMETLRRLQQSFARHLKENMF